jgi:excisionase family DNA binding protein
MAALTFYTTAEVAELLRLNPQVVARKIAGGEIPAYRIGREWRVERDQLLEWLEKHSNQRTADEKTLSNFFDKTGRLKALPAQHRKREIVLRRLVQEFEPERTYKEREVNAILRRYHDDVASLRRELVAWRMLVRSAGIYRRATATSAASSALHRA